MSTTAQGRPHDEHRRGDGDPHRTGPALRDGGARHPRHPDPDLEERPPSLRTVLDMSLAHGDATFLVYEDERTTFAEHYRIACTLAHRLRTTFGVEPGDRVAIIMRNLPEWVMAFWAAAIAGAIVVPLNAWWSGEELRYGLEDSGSKVAFVDTERVGRIRPFLGGLSTLGGNRGGRRAPQPAQGPAGRLRTAGRRPARAGVAVPAGPRDGGRGRLAARPHDRPRGRRHHLLHLGDDGTPQGRRRHPPQHVHQPDEPVLPQHPRRHALRALDHADGGGEAEKVQPAFLLSVPLFHATGCHSIMVTNVAAGGKLVMMHHFDPERALELIERERIANFGGVPAMVMQVLDSPNFAKYDTSSVRGVSYGGAPAPPDLVRRIREAWPVGQPSNGYGLTETSSVTSTNSGGDYVAKPDSVGPAVPVCDVAVVPEDYAADEPDDAIPRGPDVRGELWIKGPNVVRGYWNRPEETAKTFSKGWLHTGDVARLDEDGFIYIVDRAKDMIIRGGENVYSVQVEAALFEHPAVADSAVIGMPRSDARRGGRRRRRAPARRQGDRRGAGAARQGAPGRVHGADAHLVPLRTPAAQPPGQGAQAPAPRRAGAAGADARRSSPERRRRPGPGRDRAGPQAGTVEKRRPAERALRQGRPQRLGWGVTRRYGFRAFQPLGKRPLASSSLTAGTMITSSPSFQLTGVATL